MELTDEGIMLVGEAAESWVRLQWVDWILVSITVYGILLVGGYLLYQLIKKVQREEKENKEMLARMREEKT